VAVCGFLFSLRSTASSIQQLAELEKQRSEIRQFVYAAKGSQTTNGDNKSQ
jgi:hypothetical protein